MSNEHSIAAYWSDGMNEEGLADWARRLRARLPAKSVSLGLVFMSPKFFPHAEQVLEILRLNAKVPLLAGCSGGGLVANNEEIENAGGLVLALYSLPGAELKAVHFTQEQVEAVTDRSFWPALAGLPPEKVNGWLAFVDPFHIDGERWLQSWNQGYSGIPVFGGLASGNYPEQISQVYLDGEVFEEGGVAIAISGAVTLEGVISQGCTPIGEEWTLTRVEQNFIRQIGNRPAYAVLSETVQNLSPEEQRKLHGNLHIGLAVNEYLEEFHRGDFLIRNLISGDPGSGALAVAALPRPGQTIQFQRRDAATASEDLTILLERKREQLKDREIFGGALFCCNGRGKNLFGRTSHDSLMVQAHFGPTGLSGFFCNGEIGPIGNKNFLHGFTASLALFVGK